VIVNISVKPSQLTVFDVKIGVTVTSEIIGLLVELEAVKDGIFPPPILVKPMDDIVFVQLYEVADPVKFTVVVLLLLQIT
jgi:hypothetical protein